MKKKFCLALGSTVSLAAFLMYGCGGGGGGGGGLSAPAVSSTPTAITTVDSAAKAGISGVDVMKSAYDMGSSSSPFGSAFSSSGLAKQSASVSDAAVGNRLMQQAAKNAAPLLTAIDWQKGTAKTVAAATEMTGMCTSGTAMMDFGTSQTSGTITYNKCRNGAIEQNGTISINNVGNANNIFSANISIGSSSNSFTTTYYTTTTSTDKKSENRMVLTMSGFSLNSTNEDISVTLSGSLTEEDFVALTKSETTMSNFSTSNSFNSTTQTSTVTIGTGSLTMREYTKISGAYVLKLEDGMSFKDFTVRRNESNGTYTVNGTFAIASTPSKCIDGTFAVATTTPINDAQTAGVMTINGNTTITFNSTNVTVAIVGQPTRTYASLSEFKSVCADFSI